jgi:hypothetical protein
VFDPKTSASHSASASKRKVAPARLDALAVNLESGVALFVEGDDREWSGLSADPREPAEVDPLALQAAPHPVTPEVVPDPAEQGRLAAGAGGRDGHVGERPAGVGDEEVRLLAGSQLALADEVSDRLSEAEDRHRLSGPRAVQVEQVTLASRRTGQTPSCEEVPLVTPSLQLSVHA